MPTQTETKTERVRSMFDDIATRYDLLNKLMTFGVDRSWRHRAVHLLKEDQPTTLLDVAVGTADLALDMAERIPSLRSIVGVDISTEMLEKGEEKVRKAHLPFL
ncbi:class I SAM-dependent methyltransferase [Porphyromonas gingivicanis]|uniref:class I SAM-dependent methyltransferase n=1 Tax=Porphyromonas gingivicanis TaxID=266762 RepID=UPI00068844EF|nr:class I SAM-dependent methyltransferase [Porphyromonas gingivicanis]